MEVDSRKTLIKICVPAAGGILTGIYLLFCGWSVGYLLILPIYLIGLVYGISRVGPAMVAFMRSMFKAMASLFLFRMFFWVIFILILIPLGLGFLALVCWVVGFPLAIVDIVNIIKARNAAYGGRANAIRARRNQRRLRSGSGRNARNEYDDDDD